MKTIKSIICKCGEEVFEDDYANDAGFLACINCGQNFPVKSLVEREIAEITHEKL